MFLIGFPGEFENDSPVGQRGKGGQDLPTVAKDEKIRLPTTVYAKINIWFTKPNVYKHMAH